VRIRDWFWPIIIAVMVFAVVAIVKFAIG